MPRQEKNHSTQLQIMLHLKRAVQDIRQNRFLNLVTMITIALSVLIVSAFALFFINTNDLMNSWRQGVRVMVYLKPETTKPDIPDLEKRLSAMYGVKQVEFISKENALAQLKTQMRHQSSLLDNLKENPLPDSFEIRIGTAADNWERLEKLVTQIEALPGVASVEYGQQWIGRFSNIFKLFTLAGYALGTLFFMAAVFFVANTIRLVLYSRREEVEIMRLVGAEDRFIKSPFYIEAIIQGAFGGVIGLTSLFVLFLFISTNVNPELAVGAFQLRFLPPQVLALIVLASMFVGWLGCLLSLRQFLKV